MFNEKNKKSRSTVNANINLKEIPFVRLSDLVGRDVVLYGYFFTNGDYGKQLVAVSEDFKINMPNRYVSVFEEFTDEEIEVIKNGGLVLANIREYIGKTGRKTFTFDYKDNF